MPTAAAAVTRAHGHTARFWQRHKVKLYTPSPPKKVILHQPPHYPSPSFHQPSTKTTQSKESKAREADAAASEGERARCRRAATDRLSQQTEGVKKMASSPPSASSSSSSPQGGGTSPNPPDRIRQVGCNDCKTLFFWGERSGQNIFFPQLYSVPCSKTTALVRQTEKGLLVRIRPGG